MDVAASIGKYGLGATAAAAQAPPADLSERAARVLAGAGGQLESLADAERALVYRCAGRLAGVDAPSIAAILGLIGEDLTTECDPALVNSALFLLRSVSEANLSALARRRDILQRLLSLAAHDDGATARQSALVLTELVERLWKFSQGGEATEAPFESLAEQNLRGSELRDACNDALKHLLDGVVLSPPPKADDVSTNAQSLLLARQGACEGLSGLLRRNSPSVRAALGDIVTSLSDEAPFIADPHCSAAAASPSSFASSSRSGATAARLRGAPDGSLVASLLALLSRRAEDLCALSNAAKFDFGAASLAALSLFHALDRPFRPPPALAAAARDLARVQLAPRLATRHCAAAAEALLLLLATPHLWDLRALYAPQLALCCAAPRRATAEHAEGEGAQLGAAGGTERRLLAVAVRALRLLPAPRPLVLEEEEDEGTTTAPISEGEDPTTAPTTAGGAPSTAPNTEDGTPTAPISEGEDPTTAPTTAAGAPTTAPNTEKASPPPAPPAGAPLEDAALRRRLRAEACARCEQQLLVLLGKVARGLLRVSPSGARCAMLCEVFFAAAVDADRGAMRSGASPSGSATPLTRLLALPWVTAVLQDDESLGAPPGAKQDLTLSAVLVARRLLCAAAAAAGAGGASPHPRMQGSALRPDPRLHPGCSPAALRSHNLCRALSNALDVLNMCSRCLTWSPGGAPAALCWEEYLALLDGAGALLEAPPALPAGALGALRGAFARCVDDVVSWKLNEGVGAAPLRVKLCGVLCRRLGGMEMAEEQAEQLGHDVLNVMEKDLCCANAGDYVALRLRGAARTGTFGGGMGADPQVPLPLYPPISQRPSDAIALAIPHAIAALGARAPPPLRDACAAVLRRRLGGGGGGGGGGWGGGTPIPHPRPRGRPLRRDRRALHPPLPHLRPPPPPPPRRSRSPRRRTRSTRRGRRPSASAAGGASCAAWRSGGRGRRGSACRSTRPAGRRRRRSRGRGGVPPGYPTPPPRTSASSTPPTALRRRCSGGIPSRRAAPSGCAAPSRPPSRGSSGVPPGVPPRVPPGVPPRVPTGVPPRVPPPPRRPRPPGCPARGRACSRCSTRRRAAAAWTRRRSGRSAGRARRL